MSWLWLWHVGFDFFLSCGGWVCVFGVGPMFLGLYRVCRGWLFGDTRVILLQSEEN